MELSDQHLSNSLWYSYWPLGCIWVSCCFSSWIAEFPPAPTKGDSSCGIWLQTSTPAIQRYSEVASLHGIVQPLSVVLRLLFSSGPQCKFQRYGGQFVQLIYMQLDSWSKLPSHWGMWQTRLPVTLTQAKVSLQVNTVSVNLHQHHWEVDLACAQNNFTTS